jgi:hypothetical protein
LEIPIDEQQLLIQDEDNEDEEKESKVDNNNVEVGSDDTTFYDAYKSITATGARMGRNDRKQAEQYTK